MSEGTKSTVELVIAGQTHKLVTSAKPEELRALAGEVEARLRNIVPSGKAIPPQAMLLAALALAHDIQAERAEKLSFEQRTHDFLLHTVSRIDELLETRQA